MNGELADKSSIDEKKGEITFKEETDYDYNYN